jgi:hypothetical protein
MHLDPESMRELVERWEVGLMALIRDRYCCAPEAAVQIRRRFEEYQMDASGRPLLLGSDDRPVLDAHVLAVLDGCAHPEWAEQAAQRAADALRRSNVKARALAATLASEGLACPHCCQHTKDVRFVEPSLSEELYFICRECGRSFVPADLERTGRRTRR